MIEHPIVGGSKIYKQGEKMKHARARSLETHPGTPEVHAPTLADFTSFSSMLECMSTMTCGARALGEAADILCEMFKHCDCNVLTISGAASVGKLDYMIAELIDKGLIHCVVCTGAVITHGCSYEMGGKFFMVEEEEVNQDADVAEYNRGYNRVFDTLELETSLEKTADLVVDICREGSPTCHCISSQEIHYMMGERLCKDYPNEDGILHAAHRNGVPIIVPAFSDSEVGLSFARCIIEMLKDGQTPPIFDPFKDLDCYCSLIKKSECRGILTLGGGAPRNWAQQVGPFFDSLSDRGLLKLKEPVRFKYAIRICPEFTEWGGLSGCTYSEGISWGKFIPEKEGGRFAEVYNDYTTVFPLLIKGVMERL